MAELCWVHSIFDIGTFGSHSTGDKANHIPVFHVPQLYYFIGFSTAFGWPVLLGSKEGLPALLHEVRKRMIGSKP